MLVARDVDLILGMECSAAPRRDDTRFHREELLGDVLDAVAGHRSPAGRPGADRPRRAAPARAGSRRRSAGRATRCSSPAAAARALSPKVAHRAGDWQAVMGLVAGGLGISLVPRLAHTAPPAGRRDHPAHRRAAQAPRVRRLPRRAPSPRPRSAPCSTRWPTAPAPDAAGREPHDGDARCGSRAPRRRRRHLRPGRGPGGLRAGLGPGPPRRRRRPRRHLEGLGHARHARHELEGVVGLRRRGARRPADARQVNDAVVEAMLAGYREHLPLLPGAREAIERLGATPHARPRVLLEPPGDRSRAARRWASPTASPRPSPPRRSRAASPRPTSTWRRCGASASPSGIAIEDSENGIKSAHAAGLRVIAIPNPHFPPADDALALADEILPDLDAVRTLSGGERVVAGRVQREARRGAGDLQQAPDRSFRARRRAGACLKPRAAGRRAGSCRGRWSR